MFVVMSVDGMDAVLSGQKKSPELYDHIGCDRSSSVSFVVFSVSKKKFQVEQITAEYRSRVRDCHPDKAGAEASDRFVLIQAFL